MQLLRAIPDILGRTATTEEISVSAGLERPLILLAFFALGFYSEILVDRLDGRHCYFQEPSSVAGRYFSSS